MCGGSCAIEEVTFHRFHRKKLTIVSDIAYVMIIFIFEHSIF